MIKKAEGSRWGHCWALAPVVLLAISAGCATGPRAKKPSTPAEWRAEMQAPLPEEQSAEIAKGLTLPRAVQLAAERNPMAASARKQWLAKIQAEPQAVTPPDPMLQGDFRFTPITMSTGEEKKAIGFVQQIPWPQKLWAKGKQAAADADIAELRYEGALRDVITDVKDAYYELFYLDQAIPVTETIKGLLNNDAILAYSELTVGRTELNEAFRAESQSAQLGYDLILLTQQRASQAERLKSLLNLPPDTVIGPVRSAPVYTVAPTVDELYDRAEHFSEMLKIKGLETQRAAYETFLAKLSRIPDVSAGLNFVTMNRARMPETVAPIETDPVTGAAVLPTSTTPSTPKEVLKNPRVGLFSMNLPIFEWRNRALVREQKALEETMRLDALSELNGVRAAVAQAYFQEELTGRLVRLYTNTLLPEAEGVMRQAETYFRNDQSSFSNVLETTLAYHNFTLARLRAVADHGQAIDRLEKVLGTTADVRSDAPETTPQAKDAKP